MKLYHVVAMARNRVIGKDNRLPWHFSSDLKHFRDLTWGSTVLMGRKTFEGIGKPLPGRENFVLSRTKQIPGNHLYFFDSLEKALASIKTQNAFIIGGATLYAQTMECVDGIYLTLVDADYEGEAHYPEIPASFTLKTRTTLQENPPLDVIYYEGTKPQGSL